MLEREHELAALHDAASAAFAGEGSLLLIEAPAGVGKSALLRAATAGIEDAHLMAARGAQLEGDFAFGVTRQLFEPVLRGADRLRLETLLRGSARLAAPLLDLGDGGDAGDGSPYPLLHGLYWLMVNLAEERPIVLVVDDVHWADEQSVRFLLYLTRRLAGLPVAVLAGTRPGPSGSLVAELVAAPEARVLRPELLSTEAADILVRAWRPDAEPGFAAACHRATGGNPLLLRELLVALQAEDVAPVAAGVARVEAIGPQPVSRAVYLTLRRLPEEATALARAASVLGDGVALDRVATLARLDADAAGRAAGALAEAGVLASEEAISFAHPIIRAALYEELQPAERGLAHAAAATSMAAAGDPVERVAGHLLKAPPSGDERAVRMLRRAAATAVGEGAPASAVTYLRRALREPPEPDQRAALLAELGRAEVAAGAPEAAEHLRAGLAITDDLRSRARLACELADAHYAAGRFAEAAATAKSGLEDLGDADPELAAELEAAWAAAVLWESGGSPAVRGRIEDMLAQGAAGAGPALRALMASVAGLEMLRGEDRERCVALACGAWDDGSLLTAAGVESTALWSVTGSLLSAEAWPQVERVVDAIRALAAERGAVHPHATASYVRALMWLWRGRLGEALADIAVTFDARRDGWETYVPAAQYVHARALTETGDIAGARAAVRMSPAEEARWKTSPTFGALCVARGWLALLDGDAARALAEFRSAGELLERELGARNPAFFGWRPGAALATARIGDLPEARAISEEDISRARVWGSPRALGRALRVRGTFERPRDGLEWLQEAVAVLADGGAALEQAHALVALGTALRVTNQRTRAREPLRAGLDLARACGAAPLAARAREELVAAGGRPRRERLSGPGALTASERRVADRAAAGATNREIAEALFVTKKAVEFHLANAYRKLDVPGRDGLAAVLRGDG